MEDTDDFKKRAVRRWRILLHGALFGALLVCISPPIMRFFPSHARASPTTDPDATTCSNKIEKIKPWVRDCKLEAIFCDGKQSEAFGNLYLVRDKTRIGLTQGMNLRPGDVLFITDPSVEIVVFCTDAVQIAMRQGQKDVPLEFQIPSESSPFMQESGNFLYRVKSEFASFFKVLVGPRQEVTIGVEGTVFQVLIEPDWKEQPFLIAVQVENGSVIARPGSSDIVEIESEEEWKFWRYLAHKAPAPPSLMVGLPVLISSTPPPLPLDKKTLEQIESRLKRLDGVKAAAYQHSQVAK